MLIFKCKCAAQVFVSSNGNDPVSKLERVLSSSLAEEKKEEGLERLREHVRGQGNGCQFGVVVGELEFVSYSLGISRPDPGQPIRACSDDVPVGESGDTPHRVGVQQRLLAAAICTFESELIIACQE